MRTTEQAPALNQALAGHCRHGMVTDTEADARPPGRHEYPGRATPVLPPTRPTLHTHTRSTTEHINTTKLQTLFLRSSRARSERSPTGSLTADPRSSPSARNRCHPFMQQTLTL